MKSKKDKKETGCNWKNALLDGLVEVGIVWLIIIAGLGIGFLLPRESLEDIPFELLMLVGGMIVFPIVGIICYLVKRKKDKQANDPMVYYYEYVVRQFQFLVDHGYTCQFRQKHMENEFVYELGECYVQVSVNDRNLECVIQGKTLVRTNITQSRLVDENWKQRFYIAHKTDKIQMIVCFLKENTGEFLL